MYGMGVANKLLSNREGMINLDLWLIIIAYVQKKQLDIISKFPLTYVPLEAPKVCKWQKM